MRPQDIVVLLKVVAKGEGQWKMKDLAQELYIGPSEISEAFQRNIYARLMMPDKKNVFRNALLEFLRYGLKYAFPQQLGAIARGMPTAHSADPLKETIVDAASYIWADAAGTHKGQIIVPLYPTVPKACRKDRKLYELLALTDALRVVRNREQQLAFEIIKERFECRI